MANIRNAIKRLYRSQKHIFTDRQLDKARPVSNTGAPADLVATALLRTCRLILRAHPDKQLEQPEQQENLQHVQYATDQHLQGYP